MASLSHDRHTVETVEIINSPGRYRKAYQGTVGESTCGIISGTSRGFVCVRLTNHFLITTVPNDHWRAGKR